MRLVVIIQTSVQERVTLHPLPVPPRLLAVNEPPKSPELAIRSKLSVEAMSHTVLVEDIPPELELQTKVNPKIRNQGEGPY